MSASSLMRAAPSSSDRSRFMSPIWGRGRGWRRLGRLAVQTSLVVQRLNSLICAVLIWASVRERYVLAYLFKRLDGGCTRTRTLDPLIKSQLLPLGSETCDHTGGFLTR